MIGRFVTWLLNLAAIALLVAFVLLIPRASESRPSADAIPTASPAPAAAAPMSTLTLIGEWEPLPRTGAPNGEHGAPLSQAPADGPGPTGTGDDPLSSPVPASASLDLADFASLPPLAGFGRLHPIADSWYRGVASGIASHMGYGFGAGYLALPIGPGYRVRICGAGGCVEMTSNDAGPDLQKQREGRVADLSVAVFVHVCGVPASLGLCQVSVTVIGRVR